MADRMVRDQIVIGIRDMKLKERLIREKDLNFDKCIELCKISESTASRLKKFQSPEKEVNAVGKKKTYKPKNNAIASQQQA